jgi:hypothetical protein
LAPLNTYYLKSFCKGNKGDYRQIIIIIHTLCIMVIFEQTRYKLSNIGLQFEEEEKLFLLLLLLKKIVFNHT